MRRVRSRCALRARPQAGAHQSPRNRPRRVPPAAMPRDCLSLRTCPSLPAKARSGRRQRAFEAEPGHKPPSGLFVPGEGPGLCARRGLQGPRSAGLGAARASALRDLTRCVCPSAANAVSVASYATGPQDRAPQGSRSAAKTASIKRCRLPGRAFAAPTSVQKARSGVRPWKCQRPTLTTA